MKFFQDNDLRDSELSAEIFDDKVSWLHAKKLKLLDKDLWPIGWASIACDLQNKVFVPVFSTEMSSYNFGGQAILPFTKCRNDGEEVGAFGRVYKVKIRPGHFKDPSRAVSLQSTIRIRRHLAA